MNNTIDKVKNYIKQNNLISKGDRVLLSCSAGKDSMAMLHIMMKLSRDMDFSISLFHLNHMMRGKDSDMDESFIKGEAVKFNLEIFSEKFDFHAEDGNKGSFEERARDIRYGKLQVIAEKYNFNKIATAHSLNDNAETLLMRIFSGTGIHGLRGIRPKRENIIRPILDLSVREIISYLEYNKISWREDLSNSDNSYDRNYIRNEVFPVINRQYSRSIESINELSNYAAENISLINTLADKLYGDVYEVRNNTVHIKTELFNSDINLFKHLISRAVREHFGCYISSGMIGEICRRFLTEKSNNLLYENRIFFVEKLYNAGKPEVKISPAEDLKGKVEDWEYEIRVGEGIPVKVELTEPGVSILIKYADLAFFEQNKFNKKYIFVTFYDDIDTIYIRNRRKGDRIHLESGTKKIKDLFIEKKLDNETKNRTQLLIINSKIAAVMPGFFIDEKNRVSMDFIVKNNSKKILVICKN